MKGILRKWQNKASKKKNIIYQYKTTRKFKGYL